MSGNVLWKNNRSQTILDDSQNQFSINVKTTTFQIDGDRIQFYGQAARDSLPEEVVVRYTIDSEAEKAEWVEQDIPTEVIVLGQLREPSSSRNFYQFDYQKYLERRGIFWIVDAEEIVVDKASTSSIPVRYKLDHLRQDLFNVMDQRLDGAISKYTKAILFADRRSLSEEVIQQYRAIGIIHLLSISGLHIQFLISRCRRLLLRMGITRETTAILLLIFLPIYGTLAGWGVSVFRAISQTMLALIAFLLNKQSDSLDNWALTMLMALMIHPFSIYTIGFQLSYLLSGLLIILTKQKWIREMSQIKISLFLSFMISVASIPILSYHFYEFPWIALLANILFVPFFSWVFLPMLVLLFLFSWILYGSSAFSFTMHYGNQLIESVEEVLAFTADLRYFSFVTGRLSFIAMLSLFVGLWLMIHAVEISRKRAAYILSGVCLFSFGLYSERLSPVGKVLMIDVGQGEAILIKEPFNQGNTLIDTGGQINWWEVDEWRERESPFSLGKDVVVPVIKSQGVDRIDQVYLSHADMDHTGALEDIVNEMPVRDVWATKETFLDPFITEQLPALYENNVNLHTLTAPELLSMPGNDFILLHPLVPTGGRNNDSLVLYGTLGAYTWLFTGDLEEVGENQLISEFPNLKVDILNVAHHGSNTSTHEAFINRIDPEMAWISSGENNTYGHPHPNVIERLKENNTKIYRTDEQGAVLYQYSTISILDEWLPEIKVQRPADK